MSKNKIIKLEDARARKSEAYNVGVKNYKAGKSGPNPYPDESQDWYDFEFGWGETSHAEEIAHG